MQILIDGKPFTQDEIHEWKKGRIKKVLRNLGGNRAMEGDINMQNDALTALKMGFSYDKMVSLLKRKLIVGEWVVKIGCILSGNRRRKAVTIIHAGGITARELSRRLNAIMQEDTEQYRKVNLSVCPDHYVLKPRRGFLEVIETTGNAPVPVRFFITFDDETGIKEPRDPGYTYQSAGVARLKNGTIIGGVRHQFKDAPAGIEARLLVEFPGLCPVRIIKEHQKHLAAEWSGWIAWITEHPE